MAKGKPFDVVKGTGQHRGVEVKIYRRKQGKYTVYQVADYTPKGRVMRSFTDPAKAKAEAKASLARRTKHDGQIVLSGEPARRYQGALDTLKPTGIEIDVAAMTFAELLKILNGANPITAAEYYREKHKKPLPQKTVQQAVDEFIEVKRARKRSDRHLSDLGYRLGKFAESFVETQLASVSGQQIQQWLDGLKLSDRSYINFRRVIGALFKYAVRQEWLPSDWNEMRKVEQGEDNGDGEIEIYAPTEITRLLKAASDQYRPCLAIAAFAGLRSSEIERLTWQDINLERDFITVKGRLRKRGTPARRVVPILPNLKAWLKPSTKPAGRVWTGTHRDFYKAHSWAAEATAGEGTEAVERKENAARHSFISYRLAVVQNINQVALEAGNSATTIHTNYHQLVDPKQAAEWFAIAPEDNG